MIEIGSASPLCLRSRLLPFFFRLNQQQDGHINVAHSQTRKKQEEAKSNSMQDNRD